MNDDSAKAANFSGDSGRDSASPPAKLGRSGIRYVVGRLISFSLLGAVLFLAAGRLDWARAWVYLTALFAGELVSAAVLAAASPETLNQRGSRHRNTKPFDKVVLSLWVVIAFSGAAVAGLDAGRYGWSSMPFEALYVGLAAISLAWALGTWAMASNVHFETTVRIQQDRGHQVATSGPYRVVRHPGYVAAILGTLAAPLILGSAWLFATSGATTLLFIVRTALEDRTLHRELSGYPEYAAQTRYRLLPGVW